MIAENAKRNVRDDQVEQLRLILEQKNKRQVTTDEAAEVGQSLLDLYELLADRSAEAVA